MLLKFWELKFWAQEAEMPLNSVYSALFLRV